MCNGSPELQSAARPHTQAVPQSCSQQSQTSTFLLQAAQRALVVAREKAANEAKSEFMSLMCHEVRTPLNGCLASAEMLLETPLLDEQRELTNTIRISGSILLSTVSNFLDFFKVQAGKKLDIVRTPFHIMDLITDVHCIVEAMMGPSSSVRAPPLSLPAYCDTSALQPIYVMLCIFDVQRLPAAWRLTAARRMHKDGVTDRTFGKNVLQVASVAAGEAVAADRERDARVPPW